MDIATFLGLSSLSVVTVSGFFATIVRMWASNERVKAESTVEMLLDWTNNLDLATDRCILLTSSLDSALVKKIWMREPVKIEVTQKSRMILELIFHNTKIEEIKEEHDNGGKAESYFKLCESHTGFIEFHWKTYLNRLEFMLAAWLEQTIDERIMLEQLGRYITNNEQSLYLLIVPMKIESFPNIYKFITEKLYLTGRPGKKSMRIIRILSQGV